MIGLDRALEDLIVILLPYALAGAGVIVFALVIVGAWLRWKQENREK